MRSSRQDMEPAREHLGSCQRSVARRRRALPMTLTDDMTVMNIVWPVSALFGTVLIVWAYFRYGRLATMADHLDRQQQRAGSAQQ
jgi:hypothetical protein